MKCHQETTSVRILHMNEWRGLGVRSSAAYETSFALRLGGEPSSLSLSLSLPNILSFIPFSMWSRMSPNVIDWKLDLLGKGKGLQQGRCSRLDRSCATLPWNPAPRALAHTPPIHPRCFCTETRSKTLHLALFIQTLAMMTEFYHILISSSGARTIPARTRTQQTHQMMRARSNSFEPWMLPSSHSINKNVVILVVDGMRRRKQFRYEWIWNFTKPLLWWPNRIASHPNLKLGLEIPTRTWI